MTTQNTDTHAIEPPVDQMGSPLTIPGATSQNRVSLGVNAAGPVTHDPVMPVVEDTRGTWETAKNVFMKENTLAQMVMAHGVADAFDDAKVFDPNFNRYEYFLANKDQYKDIAPYMSSGGMDSARSVESFRYKAQLIREQLNLASEIEHGGTGGQLLGMGLSMFDVTSLMSFGALAKAGKGASLLTRIGTGAAVGLGDAAVQEVALQYMDETRDANDAWMSLGAGTVLGGGIGALIKHWDPTMPGLKGLEPGAKENGLAPHNLDAPGNLDVTHDHKIGQLPEEGVTMHGDKLSDDGTGMSGSIGAAAVKDASDIEWAGAGNRGITALAEKTFSKLFEHWTPIARMQHYIGEARESLASLVDLGGRMTRGMADGRALRPDAETLHEVYKQRGRSVLSGMDDDYRDLQMALGQSGLATKLKNQAGRMTGGASWADKNAVKRDVFNATIEQIQSRKSRDNVSTEAEVKAILKTRGMDEDAINTVYAHATKSVDRSADLYQSLGKEAVERGLMTADQLKPRGYMPQVYMRAAIREDRAGFKAMLMKHLSTSPADDWLEERLMDMVKHNADGTSTPLYANLDAVKKDDIAMREAHREWIGETERLEKDRIDHQFESAMGKAYKAADLYNTIAEGTAGLAKDVKLRTMKERALHTQRVEADLHGRSVGYAKARADKAQSNVDALEARLGGDKHSLAEGIQGELSQTGQRIDEAGASITAARNGSGDAQSLVNALTGERAGLATDARPKREVQAERDRINGELKDARATRDEALTDLGNANAKMDEAGKLQSNLQRWNEAVHKEVDKYSADYETAKNKAGVDHMIAGLEDRLDMLRQAEHDAGQNVKFARDLLSQSKQGQAMSKAELKAAMKEGRLARRARDRADKATPMNEYIDNLTNAMSGDDKYPGGLLLDADAEAARFKERQFKWSQEHWDELASQGFVQTNSGQLAERYVKTVGAHLSLNKALDGRTRPQVLKEVRAKYEEHIGTIRDPKVKAQQTALADSAIKDIDAQFDRILGKYELGEDSLVSYAGGKLRQMGHLRYGGGFIFNAAGDLATLAASAPGFMRQILPARKIFKDLIDKVAKGEPNAKALVELLESMETGAHVSSSFSTHGASSRDVLGFGSGQTRALSGKVDKVMNLLGERVNTLSGLGTYSTATRRLAGITQMGNIAKLTAKGWDKMSPGERADMVAVGIGKAESAKIAKLYAMHGEQVGALTNPGITKWYGEPGGAEMVDVFNAALIKTQKRASYTSGYGNMPLFMDSDAGKLFLQFQSFGLQMSNNFFQAGLQRAHVVGGVEGHARLASTFGVMIAGAALTSGIRAQMRGEDITQWDEKKWAREVMSRSGIMGVTQSYVDAGSKLVGPQINEFLGANLFDAKSSKYNQNKWYESAMGPWLGNLGQIGQSIGSAVSGDTAAAWKKAKALIPLNQQLKLFGLME
jgi:hypothetical protein